MTVVQMGRTYLRATMTVMTVQAMSFCMALITNMITQSTNKCNHIDQNN